MDQDLISFLNYNEEGAATLLGTWVEWIADQFDSLVKQRLQQVPDKAKKVIPFFYWATAPTHHYFSKDMNKIRVKFNL